MKRLSIKPVRCAIHTRLSTDHGLEQDFNSLDAQHDAAQAYVRSQAHAGWAPTCSYMPSLFCPLPHEFERTTTELTS